MRPLSPGVSHLDTPADAPVPLRRAAIVTLGVLAAAAVLQWLVYAGGGHALSDVPGRFVAWRIHPGAFPYVDRRVEYPVVIGYVAYAAAWLGRSASSFFLANGVLDVGLAVTMTVLLRARGGGRLWRWLAGAPLFLYAFHNWDLLAMVPAIVGLYALERGSDRLGGFSLAVGASTKVFPGLFLPPLVVMRWSAGDRRGAVRLFVWATGTMLALNLPVALARPSGWWYPAVFQGRRAASWGSLWFWLLRLPGFRELTRIDPARVATLLAAVSLAAAIATIAVVAVRRELGVVAVAAAVTGAFLLTNKIYSPNYDLWLVPFFVLLPIARRHWLVFCASDLAVYVLVYGHFHGLWGVDPVRAILPVLVVSRALSIIAVIRTSLRASTGRRTRTGQPLPSHAASPNASTSPAAVTIQ